MRSEVWVAVVCKGKSILISGRNEGDWACFMSSSKDEAVSKALEAARRWSGKGYGDYQVLVGKLSQKASYRTEYNLVSI